MDIRGPLQTRGETRCPGGVSEMMLESVQNSVKTLEKEMRDIKRWKFQASRNNDAPVQNGKQCYNCGSTDSVRLHIYVPSHI